MHGLLGVYKPGLGTVHYQHLLKLKQNKKLNKKMNTHTHTKCYLEMFSPPHWSYMCVGGKTAERD